jgi:hypothetical protein
MTSALTPAILTHSGKIFDFVNPHNNVIDIEDIGHALSQICRFTGHTKEFYSVAQHSVLVSQLLEAEHLEMEGLLHDAAEAYLGDVSSPLKQLLPDYKAIEMRVEAVVLAEFGINPLLPKEVKFADQIALHLEQRVLMPDHSDMWNCTALAESHMAANRFKNLEIIPLSPARARDLFMDRFYALSFKHIEKDTTHFPRFSGQRAA